MLFSTCYHSSYNATDLRSQYIATYLTKVMYIAIWQYIGIPEYVVLIRIFSPLPGMCTPSQQCYTGLRINHIFVAHVIKN